MELMLAGLAGLVIGIVIFALVINHRRPDDADFIRQFEKATQRLHRAAPLTEPADKPLPVAVAAPVLRLRRRDFRGSYIGPARLDGWGGDIEIEPELGEVQIRGNLNLAGNLRVGAGTLLRIGGELNCGGSLYVASSLDAGRTIEAGQSIHCGDTVSSSMNIFCSGTIGCGRSVQAAGNILARENIRSGVDITAGGAIHAGGTIEAPVVKAGRSGDPRTITCSRLLRGRVNLGELVETGDGRV